MSDSITDDSFGINDAPPPGRIVHRLAVLIICLVWPLIWVGSLVTTYDAGMAVPDWPNTYGYNLFLYPYKTWLLGPFDLFIEHGHRLLGAVVGVVAIALCIAAVRCDPRRWVFGFSIFALLAVIAQGALGGVRVLQGDRTLAMVHGCFGPAFFACCVGLAVVTSRFWWERSVAQLADSGRRGDSDQANPVRQIGRFAVYLTLGLVVVSYVQLVLGAQLRHVQPGAKPSSFTLIVAFHLMTAFVLWLLTVVNWQRLRRCGDLTLSRPAAWLIGLVGLQIMLGTGTWVVNYGWPTFLQSMPGAAGFVIKAKGFADSIIVSGHVAMGSLILAISTMIWVRTLRIRWVAKSPKPVPEPTTD